MKNLCIFYDRRTFIHLEILKTSPFSVSEPEWTQYWHWPCLIETWTESLCWKKIFIIKLSTFSANNCIRNKRLPVLCLPYQQIISCISKETAPSFPRTYHYNKRKQINVSVLQEKNKYLYLSLFITYNSSTLKVKDQSLTLFGDNVVKILRTI